MSWYGPRPPMGVGPPMGFGMGMRPPMGGPMGGMPPQGGPRAIHYSGRPRRDVPSGPAVTIFVGNITERAPDAMVRHLLTTCGPVISWKRVQGATGKLQAFGFCEYNNPDAGLRAMRLLNNFNIADKDLVVKVDSKTRKILEEYISERIKKGGDEVEVPKEDEIENYEDEDIKYEDGLTRDRIQQILVDHAKEIESYIPKEPSSLPQAREQVPSATLIQRMGTRDEGLDDVEPEKIGIINSEIHKFRETMKMREAEKEEQQDKKRDRKSPSRKRSRSREDSRDTRDSRGRDNRSRDKDRERSSRHRERSKSVERRRPAASRSKSRSPVRFDRVRGSRDRDNRSQKEVYKDREMEEEEKERKRAERKAREKEEGYQERLRAWETREGKKAKEYEAYGFKEKKKSDEQEREGRKLKEFLEDYDDERDDPKFYKGRELQRRLGERERESLKDAEDRKKELDEIEELKSAIYADPALSDPAQEFQRRLQERERQFLPGRDRRGSSGSHSASQAPPSHLSNSANSPITLDPDSPDQSPDIEALPPPAPVDNDSMDSFQETPDPPAPVQPQVVPPPTTIHRTKVETKRKKLPVADIFNQEDDDDADKPKKKLKPLPPPTTDSKKDNKSADEKRKHIKSLIEKIPTDKTDLFAYNIDWDLVDNQLMEKRIRPWVNKKIAEYIGEPEPSLTDFICSKVLAGSNPKAILEDVQMVLDEEAEVFVVKMWRLLIYEIENKKQKSQGVVNK